MSTLRAKRMAKERRDLEKPNPDYFVIFKDENLFSFDAYVVGPEDSLYRHKFVKLHFEVPENYPMSPPTVKFIQHTGDRIHPNLYVNGKVCLSILGTWPGEPWAYSMTIHVVLITIRSILDNEPYKHEPDQKNNREFNLYVEHTTWQWLLIDYLEKETDPQARSWLQKYVREHGQDMMKDLSRQQTANSRRASFSSPYKHSRHQANYPKLISGLQAAITAAGPPGPAVAPVAPVAPAGPPSTDGPSPKRKEGPDSEITRAPVRDDSGSSTAPKSHGKRVKTVEVIDLT